MIQVSLGNSALTHTNLMGSLGKNCFNLHVFNIHAILWECSLHKSRAASTNKSLFGQVTRPHLHFSLGSLLDNLQWHSSPVRS